MINMSQSEKRYERRYEMNIVLDVCIVAIFAITIFMGYYNGFVKMLLNFFGGIACFIVALIFSPIAAEFLQINFFNGFFKDNVASKLEEMLNTASGQIDLERLFADKPQEFTDLLNRFNIDISELEQKFSDFVSNSASDTMDFISGNIVESCAYAVSYVLSFVLILIAANLILRILIWICDIIFKLPVISTADTLLGVITGGALGLLFVYVFCMLGEYLMPYLVNIDNPFFEGVSKESTLIYKFFASGNPLYSFVSVLM